MKKAKVAAVMVSLFIAFVIYPPQAGTSQTRPDSVLTLQNQMLLKTYHQMMDSIKAINQRTVEKLDRLEVRRDKDKTVVIIHDTIYLPFWKSLFHFKKQTHEKD